MKIAIDLGHFVGRDRGADGFILEETIINDVGAFAIAKLRALEHEVIETRPTQADTVIDSLSQRVNKANDNNVDLFVCLHANAGGGQGVEVFTYEAKELVQARNVLNNIVALGFRNRGIKGENLYVTNHTNADSFLIEVCFVDTQSDVDLYNSLGAEIIADAIVKGIVGETIEVNPSTVTDTQYQAIVTDNQLYQSARQFVGNRCAELQTLLNSKGYNCGEVDGVMGQKTFAQLIRFQKDNSLVSDGLAGDRTFAKLNESVEYTSSQSISDNWIADLQSECNNQGLSNQIVDGESGQNTLNGCPTLRIGSQGEITKILQKRLNALGFYCGSADGFLGNLSADAIKQFQESNGILGDMIFGKQSWSKLLGLS